MTIRTEEPISTADLASAGNTTEIQNRPPAMTGNEPAPLLPEDFVKELRTRWDTVQAGFVDEPRAAVEQADELVARAIKRLAESFADARNGLEQQWDRGDNVSTEDLRVALQKYRSFFQRLLSL
jgi:hypothetical protein